MSVNVNVNEEIFNHAIFNGTWKHLKNIEPENKRYIELSSIQLFTNTSFHLCPQSGATITANDLPDSQTREQQQTSEVGTAENHSTVPRSRSTLQTVLFLVGVWCVVAGDCGFRKLLTDSNWQLFFCVNCV